MQNEIEIVGTPEDNNPFKKNKKKKQRPFRVTDAIRKKKGKRKSKMLMYFVKHIHSKCP